MTKNNKRPSILHPIERIKYDLSKESWEDMKARILTPEEVKTFDVTFPPSWRNQPVDWIKNSLGLGKKGVPEGSGAGFVQSPFQEVFSITYGVTPTADLFKYRKIIRSQPDVQQAIQLQVTMAIGKGFTIYHPKKNIQKYLNKFANDINLLQEMLVLGQDMLGYGTAFCEIRWSDRVKKKEQIYKYDGIDVAASEVFKWDLNKKVEETTTPNIVTCPIHGYVDSGEPVRDCKFCKTVAGSNDVFTAEIIKREPVEDDKPTILGLKPLDPVYIRVRRDSYGNVFGFMQYLSAPPILLDNENMIYIKYRPHSTGMENAYGQSILLSLIRNNDLLEQFEVDSATWIHSRAVPPLIVKGGADPMHPYSSSQMKDLLTKLAGRTAASMIAVKSDVQIEELQGVARNLNLQWWLTYLLNRRFQALGVPPVLMGMPEGTNRATGEVVFQDFITRLQLIQKMISDAIETQVLYPLVKERYGENEEKPVMAWKPIVEEDRNMRAQRLIQALQARAISPNEFRTAIGFDRIDKEDEIYKPELDEIGGAPAVPPSNLLGPPKPGGGEQKTPPFAKPSPEGIKKKEEPLEQELRIKKMRLLIAQESFKDELLTLVKTAKFEVKQGDRTIKDIKTEIMEKAEGVINHYIQDAYMYGKLDSLYQEALKGGIELRMELFTISKEDLPAVAKLKEKYVSDFGAILEDLVQVQTGNVST